MADEVPTCGSCPAFLFDIESISLGQCFGCRQPPAQMRVDAPPGVSERLSRPVRSLRLGVLAFAALDRLGVLTLGDLTARTAEELLALPRFGPGSLADVRAELAARGLALKGDPAPIGVPDRAG